MFGCSRFVYNYFLDLNNKIYLEAKEKDLKKKHLNYYGCANKLTELKKENIWLKEANSQSLQQTLKDLDTAYNRFFQKKSGFPNFKSKKNIQSFRIPQDVKLGENNKIFIPKFREGIKVNIHREIEGNIRFATISKTRTGKYYISITTDFDAKKKRISDNQVGIDLGIKDFVTLSTGEKFKLEVKEGNLKYLHKQVSKKVKGSENRNKARIKLAKQYEKIYNNREDFQHKLSDKICRENKLIAIENLDIKSMLKNHNLAKSISFQGWYSFIVKLEYKSKRYNGKVEKINRFYPSSKTCNVCGFINQELTLKDRTWICPKCKNTLDRDINASKNILNQVQRELNLKSCRDDSLKPVELSSIDEAMKQETRKSSP